MEPAFGRLAQRTARQLFMTESPIRKSVCGLRQPPAAWRARKRPDRSPACWLAILALPILALNEKGPLYGPAHHHHRAQTRIPLAGSNALPDRADFPRPLQPG